MMSSCSWSGLTYDQTPCKYFHVSIIWQQHQILTTKRKLDKLKNYVHEKTVDIDNFRQTSDRVFDHLQKLEAPLKELKENVYRLQLSHSSGMSKVKLEFPRFSGTQEPAEWLDRVAQFFKYSSTLEGQRVPLASFYLEGEANQWLQWLQRSYKQDGGEITWDIFKKELVSRFDPGIETDFGEALSRVKQTGSLKDYRKEFERLSNRVEDCPTKELIGTFMGGLKEAIAEEVRMSNPNTLLKTVEMARTREVKLSGKTPFF
ncbi:conserved hypothetical protein [Ricinus communis]|uniref:Retrotransposon gag domain-containing protein n=1 Tax=Ricinus communis TaxID=3988 RepID=B9T5E0_RICCO|nr:conserved hypothetical protein [Ricinus communis]